MQTFRNSSSDAESHYDALHGNELTQDDSYDNDQSSDENYIELNPDPSCLIESLRDIGYTLETAIADIIDNSISAAANNIHIKIGFNEKKNDFYLEIIDDGFGMNREQLKIAMTIGSKNKNQSACQVPKRRVWLWLCGVRLVPSSPLQPAKKVYKLYKGGPMGGGP